MLLFVIIITGKHMSQLLPTVLALLACFLIIKHTTKFNGTSG